MAEIERVFVHAAAALGPYGAATAAARRILTDDPDTDLRELAKSVLGQPLRQASHFVELAAIGARLCLDRLRRAPRPDAGVYLGTGLGEVRRTEALFQQVMPPGPGVAAPFDFINASANMGAFYVARAAGLVTRNITVTQDLFSFEHALSLASADIRHGVIAQALVGGADENSFPRAEHQRRLALRDNRVMGEGSGWLCLAPGRDGALGEVLEVASLPGSGGGTQAWAQQVARRISAHSAEALLLLPGCELSGDEQAALRGELPGAEWFPYLHWCGVYPTAAAFGLATLFDAPGPRERTTVHVNRNLHGETMLVAVRLWGDEKEVLTRGTRG